MLSRKVKVKFLSGCKRDLDDSQALTSAQTTVLPKIKSTEYSQEYLNLGISSTEVNGEEGLCVSFAQKYWPQTQ